MQRKAGYRGTRNLCSRGARTDTGRDEKQCNEKKATSPRLQCQLPELLLIITVSVGLLPVKVWSEISITVFNGLGGVFPHSFPPQMG